MLSLKIHQCVLSCCVKIQLCFDGEIRLSWKEERNEVIIVDGERTLFHIQKVWGKKPFHNISKCYLLWASFWVRGVKFQKNLFSEKKSLSDRSYGAGENSEAEGRRFPLGSNPAALSQSDFFLQTLSQNPWKLLWKLQSSKLVNAQSTWEMDTAYAWRQASLQCQQISVYVSSVCLLR